jgi:HK97 family phage portal protein
MDDSNQWLCLPGQPVAMAASGERRALSLENPSVSIADPGVLAEAFGWTLPTDSGQSVNPSRAVSLSAVWAAIKMISGDVSRLPMQTYRRQSDGRRPVADDAHPAWDVLQPLGTANEECSTLKLWRRVMVHALLYENGYVWIDRANDGRILGLYQLLSDRTVIARKSGRLWVVTEVGDDTTGGSRLVAKPAAEVIHIEGLCLDGLAGCDLISTAREDIGVALASRQFKSRFFGAGMHAGGILQVPPGASDKATKQIEDAIERSHSSSERAFRTLVLRDGFKWHSTQVNPDQAQLTEIDESQIRDLCRRFLLSPGRLGVRNSVSYNSLEMERRDYYDTTLSYWLSMIRAEVNTKLLSAEERRQWLIDYHVSLALLWADASTLTTVATQGVNARDSSGRSIFDANEVRGWFGIAEREEDDMPLIQQPDPEAQQPQEPPAESDGGTDGGDDEDAGNTRAAWRGLIGAELGRLARRWTVQAERARNRGDLESWSQTYLDARQQSLAIEAITPAVHAAAVCGGVRDAEAGGIVQGLWSRYVSAVLTDGTDAAERAAGEMAAELVEVIR